MRTVRITALLGAVAVAMLPGCSSQAHFSNEELAQMKTKPTGGIPPAGLAAMAAKQQEAQKYMLEDMKRRGITPGPNNMPPGMAVPGGPAQPPAGQPKSP